MGKPHLSQMQIYLMNFGFFGVQIGYALQSANVSRILQGLGAEVDAIGYFWLISPVVGMVVQPLVGAMGDRGRRMPYIVVGAAMSAIALVLMPNALLFSAVLPPLLFAAAMMFFVDSSFNVVMQPFRSLVGDMLDGEQLTQGYSAQTLMINLGSIVGSLLPFVLANFVGFSNSLAWSYYIGAFVLLCSVFVTVSTTREGRAVREKSNEFSLREMFGGIPPIFWRLAVVQFFSWAALFLLWAYATPALAQSIWQTSDANSVEYSQAADWVGVAFAAYSFFAAVFSFFSPRLVGWLGIKRLFAIALFCGALGFLSMTWFVDKWLIIISMAGVGVAWSALLSFPYSMLVGSLPKGQIGLYLGLFNFTITLPQITMGLLSGVALKLLFGLNAVAMLLVAAVFLFVAAVIVLIMRD